MQHLQGRLQLSAALLALLTLLACSAAQLALQGQGVMPAPPPATPAPPSPPTPPPTSMCPASTSAPGVTLLVDPSGSGSFTFTAQAAIPDLYLFCQVGGDFHCKIGGMIFRVTVKAAPAGYLPVTTAVTWTFGTFPQLDLTEGDMVTFDWTGFHGVAQLVPQRV